MDSILTRKGLHRLIYFSTFSPGLPLVEAEQDVEIAKIIRTAVKHNREVGLTGLLLVYRRWFMQALEGHGEAVMTTYNKILSDPRHQNVVVLGVGPVSSRKFSKWTMCARRLSEADADIIGVLDLKGAFDPSGLTAAQALNLLTIVENIQLRHAGLASPGRVGDDKFQG
jgi:hypothetical protein